MVSSGQLVSIQDFYTQKTDERKKKMTILAYIIASMVRKYCLKRDAKRLENIVNMARFVY